MDTLNKALQTASSTSTLYQTDLAPQIYDILLKTLPMISIFGPEQAQGPVHQFRKRTALPTAWAQGELSDPDFRTASYSLTSVPLKIVRSWNGVSSFAQTLTQRWVDQYQEALGTSVEGLANTLEFMFLHGSVNDSYQFDGLHSIIAKDTVAGTDYNVGGNVMNLANASLQLSDLDNMIDRMKAYRNGNQDQHVIIASRNMISRISGLQTRVQRFVTPIEFEGGFRMESYRGVALLPSDIVQPTAGATSPALSGSITSGGSLAAATYYYAIASITINGEQLPSAATSGITSASTNNTAALTWTADTNAKLYRIFRGTTNTIANMVEIATIPALTYDANGNITGAVAAYNDTGATTPTAVKPLATGGEILVGANVSKNERGNRVLGAVSVLGEKMDNWLSYVPLATTNGAFRFMLEMFTALKVPYPTANIVVRNAKPS